MMEVMTVSNQVAEASGQYRAEAAGQVVPVGYKLTEVGVIPEDWVCCEIGIFNPFVTSGSRGWASFYATHGDVFVRITNMSRESIYLNLTDTKFVLLPYQSSEGKRTSLENGDILVSITADIGICSYVDERLEKPAFINQHVALIRFDKKEIHSKFVAYFLSSENVQKLFKGAADQGAKAGMNLDAVRKIRAAIPSKPEQTAIANALSHVDALISELEKLIAKKQAIKTATLQQLLTGRTRLPQFALREDGTPKGYKPSELGEIPEDWDVREIGNFAPMQRGFDLPAEQRKNGKFPVVYSNGIVNFHEKYQVTGPGVVTGRSGTLGKVHYVESNFWPHNTSLWVTKFNGSHPKFVYFLFTYIGFERFASGSGVPTLNRNDAHKFMFYIPNAIEEQTAIATILSDMDTEIQTLQQRLSKTRQIKQGMMQELLTGKTRLVRGA
jgi:type I restriction enzyme S subunit